MPAVRTQPAKKERKTPVRTKLAKKEKKEMKPKPNEHMHSQLNGKDPIFMLRTPNTNEADTNIHSKVNVHEPKTPCSGTPSPSGSLSDISTITPAQPTVLNAKKVAFRLPKKDKNGEAIHYVSPNNAAALNRLSINNKSLQTSSCTTPPQPNRCPSDTISSNTSSPPENLATASQFTSPEIFFKHPSQMSFQPNAKIDLLKQQMQVPANDQDRHPTLGRIASIPQQLRANAVQQLRARHPSLNSTTAASGRPTFRHIAPLPNPGVKMPCSTPMSWSNVIDPRLLDDRPLQNEILFPSNEYTLPSTAAQAPFVPSLADVRAMENKAYSWFDENGDILTPATAPAPPQKSVDEMSVTEAAIHYYNYPLPSAAAQAPPPPRSLGSLGSFDENSKNESLSHFEKYSLPSTAAQAPFVPSLADVEAMENEICSWVDEDGDIITPATAPVPAPPSPPAPFKSLDRRSQLEYLDQLEEWTNSYPNPAVQTPQPPPSRPRPQQPESSNDQEDEVLRAASQYPFTLNVDSLAEYVGYPTQEEQPGLQSFDSLLASTAPKMFFTDADGWDLEKDLEDEDLENMDLESVDLENMDF